MKDTEAITMLRRALGYTLSSEGPQSLAILVQELCEDHAEKTALLKRVDEYLDKLNLIKNGRPSVEK